jgi:hypothetical protein
LTVQLSHRAREAGGLFVGGDRRGAVGRGAVGRGAVEAAATVARFPGIA